MLLDSSIEVKFLSFFPFYISLSYFLPKKSSTKTSALSENIYIYIFIFYFFSLG